ncbi:hypothetical protein AAIH25_14980 [Arthrobacter crystallopoietes]
MRGEVAYAASKAALAGITLTLADLLVAARRKVRFWLDGDGWGIIGSD